MIRRLLSLTMILALIWLSLPVAAQSIPMTINPDPASTKISVVTQANLSHTRRLPTRALRDARKAMLAKEPISEEDMRKLADYNDGLAAKRYADILRARDPIGNAAEMAHYYSVATGTGRVYALKPMIAAMHHIRPEDLSRNLKRQLISVLYPHAWAGNSLALDAVIAFNGPDKLFGAMSQSTRNKIMEHGRKGSGRFELRFALEILEAPETSRAELERAAEYLEAAKQSKILAIQATATTLLSQLDAKLVTEAGISQ
ncbi:MAG: hypothetical protein NXH82_05040 [Rhodobacteraceae bacterium]|nr:hypothetical protein [Paracoccaceae bacterium]